MRMDVAHELPSDLENPDHRQPGQVIFLNGTSSSGKTTLAKELQAVLDPLYFHLQLDHLNQQNLSDLGRAHRTNNEWRIAHQRMVLGFYLSVAAFASAGNHVIVDQLFGERWRLLACLDAFAGYDVVLVAIHCPVEELDRRERARGNRGRGRAAAQIDLVHAQMQYDVEVDTSRQTARECALAISDYLAAGRRLRAFDRLRQALAPQTR